MLIACNRWFRKFAQKARLSDAALLEAVRRIENGQVDADLGGGVLKMRVARSGQGRSAGFRVIVLMKLGVRVLFMYGFAKSAKPNLTESELEGFKKGAATLLSLSDEQFQALLDDGIFEEIQQSIL